MKKLGGPSLNEPSWQPSDAEKGLRDLAYGKTHSAWGDNTDFLDSAHGQLAAAQTAEGTQAGIRDYMARTGGANTAASAATAAMMRSRGGTDLARTGLESRSRDRGEVGQLMDYLQGSLNREERGRGRQMDFAKQMFGAKAGLLQNLLGMQFQGSQADKDRALRDALSKRSAQSDFLRAAMQHASDSRRAGLEEDRFGAEQDAAWQRRADAASDDFLNR